MVPTNKIYKFFRKIIEYVKAPNGLIWQGLSYAILMFVTSELRSLMTNYNFNIMFRIGAKIQTVLTFTIYKKVFFVY